MSLHPDSVRRSEIMGGDALGATGERDREAQPRNTLHLGKKLGASVFLDAREAMSESDRMAAASHGASTARVLCFCR